MYWKTPEYLGLTEDKISEIVDGLYKKAQAEATRTCPDCGVKPGEIHHGGCDVARCGGCGKQAISCGCGDTSVTDVWTGLWPGVQECYEKRLICYNQSTDWIFDLNTLAASK